MMAVPVHTLTTDKPCYVEGERITFTGTGWGANQGYVVDSSRVYASGYADANGTFTAHDAAPPISARGIHPRRITVKGRENGSKATSATFDVVGENLFPTVDYGSPLGRTMWHVAGLLGNRPIYFHVKLGSRVYTTKVGTGDACGAIKQRLAKVPGVPRAQLETGAYRLYADNRATFRTGGRQQLRVLHIVRNGTSEL